jgi:transposase
MVRQNGAEAQVRSYPKAVFKGFPTREDAKNFLTDDIKSNSIKKPKHTKKQIPGSDPDSTVIYTDGGCINNPGPGGYPDTLRLPCAVRSRWTVRLLRLIADRGYDSDPLRKRLKVFKIDLIVPHRSNCKRPKMQDGRKLKRYRKRWKIERTFAWLGNYRRLLVRHERRIDMYRAFFHLACIMIVLNRF